MYLSNFRIIGLSKEKTISRLSPRKNYDLPQLCYCLAYSEVQQYMLVRPGANEYDDPIKLYPKHLMTSWVPPLRRSLGSSPSNYDVIGMTS